MKKYFILMILIFSVTTLIFAANDSYLISQNRFIKITPTFQSWDAGSQVTQFSMPMFFYMPVSRQLSFSLRGNGGNISGDLPELSGLTDTQLMLNYHLESKNLVFNLGVNIPSGKSELTNTEFLTSSIISTYYLDFQIPNFGQGFNVSPGFTWAHMIRENVAIGLGASYQYRGKFKPLQGMLNDYDPGDEILLTGGADIRISEIMTFTADVIFTTYTPDKLSTRKVYDSGNTILVNFQFRRYFGFNDLLLRAHYRSKSKNSYMIGGIFQEERFNSTPAQVEGQAQYRYRLNPGMTIGFTGEVHSYLATHNSDGLDIFGIGVISEMSLAKSIRMPVHFKYLFGEFRRGNSISGFEIGLGMVFGF